MHLFCEWFEGVRGETLGSPNPLKTRQNRMLCTTIPPVTILPVWYAFSNAASEIGIFRFGSTDS